MWLNCDGKWPWPLTKIKKCYFSHLHKLLLSCTIKNHLNLQNCTLPSVICHTYSLSAGTCYINDGKYSPQKSKHKLWQNVMSYLLQFPDLAKTSHTLAVLTDDESYSKSTSECVNNFQVISNLSHRTEKTLLETATNFITPPSCKFGI